MNEYHLNQISDWFNRFVATFNAPTTEEQRNYDLKIEHTVRVRAIIERLSGSLNLSQGDRSLADIIAICHDVGRFPQYRKYGTFNDATSANHAALAVQTLKAEGILDAFDEGSRSVILQAVALHNVFTLPLDLDPVVKRFAMLIRDADKLDIWRVLIEYYLLPLEERASAVVWELPDTGFCSDQAIAEVIQGRMINRTLLATTDDFKLLQISWAFDLNFDESYRILAERGYIGTLAALLPDQPGCGEAVAVVHDYIESRIRNLS
jgi:hypothetical protein